VHTLLPALLAIGAAALMALGTVVRQRASASGGRFNGRWWLGALAAFGGFLLQAVALGLGSVLLVQPLIVLSVLFALPIEQWLYRWNPSARQWLWGVLLAVGVGAFVLFARPVPALIGPQWWILVLVVGFLFGLMIAMVVYAERSPRAPRALLYGTVAGSLFGIVAVLINTIGLDWQHPLQTLAHPALYMLIVVGTAAIVCQQRAFAAGRVQASFPAMTVAEPIVSMALGMAVLGEKLNRHTWATAVSLLGLALMVAGVLRLSRLSPARREDPAPAA
jgi:drug/metabolite transporter (DMT)-like permease